MHPDNKIVSFVVITASYLRFSYAFRPRRESATFLLATMNLVIVPKTRQFFRCMSEVGRAKARCARVHGDVRRPTYDAPHVRSVHQRRPREHSPVDRPSRIVASKNCAISGPPT
jgi:hypothetical protein